MRQAGVISAIIVNYNAGDVLVQLVAELLNAVCIRAVTIIDNASNDSSLATLEGLYGDNSKLVIIQNKVNRGFAAANNQGLATVETDYVLFINPDCEIRAEKFNGLIKILDERRDVGMLGVMIRNPDGSEQRGCRRYLPDPRRSLIRVLKFDSLGSSNKVRGFDLTDTPLPPGPVEVEAISGAFMFVRQETLRQVGSWDEGYFLHCEDLDFCMRFKEKGWKILFVPQIEIIHRQGMSSRGRPVFILWNKHLGMWRFYSKFYRPQAAMPLTLIVWCGIWLRFSALAAITLLKRLFIIERNAHSVG